MKLEKSILGTEPETRTWPVRLELNFDALTAHAPAGWEKTANLLLLIELNRLLHDGFDVFDKPASGADESFVISLRAPLHDAFARYVKEVGHAVETFREEIRNTCSRTVRVSDLREISVVRFDQKD